MADAIRSSRELLARARDDPELLHAIVFAPEKLSRDVVAEPLLVRLQGINPAVIFGGVFGPAAGMSCDPTCGGSTGCNRTCGDDSCNMTCGSNSCAETCRSSCNESCKGSCNDTTHIVFQPGDLVTDPQVLAGNLARISADLNALVAQHIGGR